MHDGTKHVYGRPRSRIESGAVNQNQNVTVDSDAAEVARAVKDGMLKAWKLGRESNGKPPASTPEPAPSNNEVVPPEGGVTTICIVARKLNRTPATLRGWEKSRVAPGGIPWPSGEREGTTVIYRVAEIWPSLLKMMSDRDKAKDKQLLWEKMQIKEGEDDSDEDD